MNDRNERLTFQAGLLTLLTAILWGGHSVSVKIGLDGMPPIALAAARFVIGMIVVLFWGWYQGISLHMRAQDRRGLLLLTLIFLIQILLLNEGTHFTLASRSTILITVYPFFTALFAHLFLAGDRLSRLKVVGMVLAFAGVILIFAESLELGDLSYLTGDLMVLGSGILLGARQVYTKRLTQSIHPYALVFWQAILSLPVFIVLSALFELPATYRFTPMIVVAILYQGIVVAGICFIVYISLLRRYRASHLGVFGFATPVVGVLLSRFLLHESLTIGLLTSMVLVGAGIAIVNWEDKEKPVA